MTPAEWAAFAWLAIGCVVAGMDWHRSQAHIESILARARNLDRDLRVVTLVAFAVSLMACVAVWPWVAARHLRAARSGR